MTPISKHEIRRLDRFWSRASWRIGLCLHLPLCIASFFRVVSWEPVFLAFLLTGFCVHRASKWRVARIENICDRFS